MTGLTAPDTLAVQDGTGRGMLYTRDDRALVMRTRRRIGVIDRGVLTWFSVDRAGAVSACPVSRVDPRGADREDAVALRVPDPDGVGETWISTPRLVSSSVVEWGEE